MADVLKTPERRWTTAGVAACVLLALVGWFVVIGPQRSQASAKWAELDAAQAQTAALRSRTSALAAQFEEIDLRRAELDLKRQSLPTANDLEALVRALNDAGLATGVVVEAVTAAEPIDITPVPPAPIVPAGGAASNPAPVPTPTVPVVKPVPLFVLPVTIRASGSMADIERFLTAVQSAQPRAILFVSLNVSPGLGGATFDFPVVLVAETRVFVSPVADPALPAAPVG